MARLLFYLLLASLACRAMTGKWPWAYFGWELPGGQGRSAAERRARALLGVGPRAGRTEILEAHKRLIAVVHPDRGGTNEQVHEANAARDLLLARLLDRPA